MSPPLIALTPTWIMAAWAREVGLGQAPLRRCIAGAWLVIDRTVDGRPTCHTEDARTLPIVERRTAIWVWFGAPDTADPAAIIDLHRLEHGEYHRCVAETTASEAARVPSSPAGVCVVSPGAPGRVHHFLALPAAAPLSLQDPFHAH